MSKSVLVAGFTTRHVAVSAAKAGYDVYAVDHFCDADLTAVVKDHLAFDELDELPFAIEEMMQRYNPDFVVTTSGAELLEVPKRLGTTPDAAKRFMDKGETQKFFEEIQACIFHMLRYLCTSGFMSLLTRMLPSGILISIEQYCIGVCICIRLYSSTAPGSGS